MIIVVVIIIIIIMVMSIIYWLNLGLYRPSVWMKLILLPNLIARGQFILILLASYTWESCDIFYIWESYSSAIISQLSEKFCKTYSIFSIKVYVQPFFQPVIVNLYLKPSLGCHPQMPPRLMRLMLQLRLLRRRHLGWVPGLVNSHIAIGHGPVEIVD